LLQDDLKKSRHAQHATSVSEAGASAG